MPTSARHARNVLIALALLVAAALSFAACSDAGGTSGTPQASGTSIAGDVTPPPDDSEHVSIVIVDEELILDGHLFGRSNTVGVILSHMRPNDQTAWYPFAQRLADEGYAALTFDFRGYGASQGEVDYAKLDDDLREAVRFMQVDRGLDTVFLVGASMGATTSLVVAAEADVAGVVAVSPPAEFEDQKALAALPDVQAPALLIASEGDAPSLRFDELLDAGGSSVESKLYLGNAHGTALFDPTNEHSEAIQELILKFLHAHGGP
ncbi:MAG: alpha/beta fold hydrolase [Dehalococcoidia bacterium]